MKIVILILIVTDFLLLSIGKIIFYYHVFKTISFKDLMERFKEAFPEKEATKPKVPWKDKSVFKKVLFILQYPFRWLFAVVVLGVMFGLAIVIGIGIPTAGIWGAFWIGSVANISWAISFLIVMNVFYLLGGLGLLTSAKTDKNSIKRVLIMDVTKLCMLLLVQYYFGFKYSIGIQNLIETPFYWNITMNNLLSILLPMVFYATVITNTFALVVRFKNIFTKDREKHSTIKLHQIMFIFISSCYLGILIITDIDFSFMTDLERTMYFETLEVVKWIVTSVFIPLFLYLLNNVKKSVETC